MTEGRDVEIIIPGKVMLCGEYAVLAGERALAASIDRTMSVTLSFGQQCRDPLLSSNLWVDSQPLNADKDDVFHQAVAWGCARTGLRPATVTVNSDLDVRFGLGSSSALRLGIAYGFLAVKAGEFSQEVQVEAEAAALSLQQSQQQMASGYDVLTQSRGGVLVIQPATVWPGEISSLPLGPWTEKVKIIGGGAGAPTAAVMGRTRAWLTQAGRDAKLYRISRQLTDAIQTAVSGKNTWEQVFALTGEHRRCMAGAPDEPRQLLAQCEALLGCDQTWSIKTTGAGGEDSLLLFGAPEETRDVLRTLALAGWEPLPVGLHTDGLRGHWL